MNVLNHERRYGAKNERGAAEGIDLNSSLHFVGGLWVESFKPKSAELSGLAAAGSWGFSRTDLNLVAELVTLEFAGVNGSRVVAAGGHGSPSADSLCRGNDGQRVSNVDVYDLVPTNSECREGVSNYDAFVEDFDLWSNKDQVSADHASCCPQAARNRGQRRFGQPEGGCEKTAQRHNQAKQYVASSRSKDLSITHVSIIAGDK